MGLIISIVVTVLFSWFFRDTIRKFPVVFYLVAAAVSAFGIYFTWNPVSNELVRSMVFSIQKGHLAFAMFVVVMFIGTFDKLSATRRALNPIRAKLSIIGSILIVSHFVPYLKGYLSILGNLLSFRVGIIMSLFIAIILLVLLVLLTITSFDIIKKRMNAKSWKIIQSLAYLFFVLIFIHLAGFLISAFMQGSASVIVNGVVYMLVFLLYLVMRTRRHLLDKRTNQISGEQV